MRMRGDHRAEDGPLKHFAGKTGGGEANRKIFYKAANKGSIPGLRKSSAPRMPYPLRGADYNHCNQ